MLTKQPNPFLKMAGHSGICIGEPNLVLFSYYSGSDELQGMFLSPDCNTESFCQRFTYNVQIVSLHHGHILSWHRHNGSIKHRSRSWLKNRHWQLFSFVDGVIQQRLPLPSTALTSCWVPCVWSELWESTRIVKRGCMCAAPHKSNKCESY